MPGIRLGYDIRDSCDNQETAKLQVLELMTDRKFFTNTHTSKDTTQNAGDTVGNVDVEVNDDYGVGAGVGGDEDAECECVEENQSKLVGIVGKYRYIYNAPLKLNKPDL